MTGASFLVSPRPKQISRQSPKGLAPWAEGGESGSRPEGPHPHCLGLELGPALQAQAGWPGTQDCKDPAGQKELFSQSWGPDSVKGKPLNLPNEGIKPAPLSIPCSADLLQGPEPV